MKTIAICGVLVSLFDKVICMPGVRIDPHKLQTLTKMPPPKQRKTFCSKLVISATEHPLEVVDKLSSTAVVFFRSEKILKCKHLHGA